jgi:hypothetical protein
MELMVIEPARLETSGGIVELTPGQTMIIEPEKAAFLLDTGKFRLLRPYLDRNNTLRIPFDSDPKYHWWAGGQSIAETLAQLEVSPEIWRQYTSEPYPKKVH